MKKIEQTVSVDQIAFAQDINLPLRSLDPNKNEDDKQLVSSLRYGFDPAKGRPTVMSMTDYTDLFPSASLTGAGEWVVLSGNRRFAAMQLLSSGEQGKVGSDALASYQSVPCDVITDASRRDVREQETYGNSHILRRLSPLELGHKASQLLAEGVSAKTVSRRMAITPATITSALRLYQSPERVVDLFDSGRLTLKQVSDLFEIYEEGGDRGLWGEIAQSIASEQGKVGRGSGNKALSVAEFLAPPAPVSDDGDDEPVCTVDTPPAKAATAPAPVAEQSGTSTDEPEEEYLTTGSSSEEPEELTYPDAQRIAQQTIRQLAGRIGWTLEDTIDLMVDECANIGAELEGQS